MKKKKSVIYKSLWTMGIVMVLAVLILEMVSVILIKKDRIKAEGLFQNTITSYGELWEDKLTSTSKSLLIMVGTNSTPYYQQLCISEDPLTVETGKIQQQDIMQEMNDRYGREMTLFVYVPERQIYFTSNEDGISYSWQIELKKQIEKYIKNKEEEGDKIWNFLSIDQHSYLIRTFSSENGYIGAVVSLDRIVKKFMENSKNMRMEIQDRQGNVKTERGNNRKEEGMSYTYSLKNTEVQLCVSMDENIAGLGKITSMSFLMSAGIFLALSSILLSLGLQSKNVFLPLEKLRMAMEQYSMGKVDVRLPETQENFQIGRLYQTFNHMADQIQKLRLDVYEKELERQKVKSHYLQVQIQPHFYANILNLIHGLAQIQDYPQIQKLCRVSAAYFRYLMGRKGTFVPLEEELKCLMNYIEIQHVRYMGMLEIHVDVEGEARNVMILPLVIQTFVGNSVKHNIMQVPHLKIEVSVRKENEKRLEIRIRDNGIGFDPEVLRKINNNESLEEEGEHIGIQNIKERIQEFYGNGYNFTITSRKGFSEVRLLLLWIEKEMNPE